MHTQLKVKPSYRHVKKNATINNIHQTSVRYKNESKLVTTADLNITELTNATEDRPVDSVRTIEEAMPLFIPDGGRFAIYQDLLMKPKRTRYKQIGNITLFIYYLLNAVKIFMIKMSF